MKIYSLTAAVLFLLAFFTMADEKQEDDPKKRAQKLGETLQYLNSKKIPEVCLTDAGIQDVCKYINEKNPKRGFHARFSINASLSNNKEFDHYKKIIESKKISVLFKDISMLDFIRTVSLYFNIDYEIGPDRVCFAIGPPILVCGGMDTVIIKIPKDKFKDISILPKYFDNPKDLIAYDRKKEILFLRSERWSFLRAIQNLLIATGTVE